jgi:hypothetical protein
MVAGVPQQQTVTIVAVLPAPSPRAERTHRLANSLFCLSKSCGYTTTLDVVDEKSYTPASPNNGITHILHALEGQGAPAGICVQQSFITGADAESLYHLLATPAGQTARLLPHAHTTDTANPYFMHTLVAVRVAQLHQNLTEMTLDDTKPQPATAAEHTLRRLLAEAPWHAQQAVLKGQVDRAYFYANKLASAFHTWYTTSRILVTSDAAGTQARLQLAQDVAATLDWLTCKDSQ